LRLLKVIHLLTKLNLSLAGIKVVLPALMGFKFETTAPISCVELNNYIANSAFTNRTPICTAFLDTSGNMVIQITNLATTI